MNLEPNLESLVVVVVVVVIAVVVLLVELEQAVSNVARVDGYLQVHNCIFNGTSGAGEVPVAIVSMFTGGGGAVVREKFDGVVDVLRNSFNFQALIFKHLICTY